MDYERLGKLVVQLPDFDKEMHHRLSDIDEQLYYESISARDNQTAYYEHLKKVNVRYNVYKQICEILDSQKNTVL